MAILNILEFPDSRLRTLAKPVAMVDEGIRQLVDDMFETMYEAPGIGLAATQVNVHKRVVVMDLSEDRSEPMVFINPEIEKLEIATGESVTFDRVLLVGNGDDVNIGAPVVAGATVVAEVISQGRHDKVRIIKFRRRKHHMKRMGHRQWYTEIKITGIQA
ncbi:50S ribosomal protein L21 [Pseudomonas syringae pv. actinidiae]|nr:50S ribosomal protein L21 [Pseudomonas syringae pv. actinidiae]